MENTSPGHFRSWVRKEKCYSRPFTCHTARRENQCHRTVWLQPYNTANSATMPGADCWGCLVSLTEPLCTAHPSPFCPQGRTLLPAWDLPEEGKGLEAGRNPQQRCHEHGRQHVHVQGWGSAVSTWRWVFPFSLQHPRNCFSTSGFQMVSRCLK